MASIPQSTMAPRASWKGFLNLSLVSVPVKAYSANDSAGTLRLNQLHADCNSRVNLKTVCPACGDISRKDIIKGYEYAKDQYVVIDLDEMEKLRLKDESRAIRIEKFIHPHQVDPIHFSESSYFLIPDGAPGQKPYALLREAMERKQLVCIAQVVLHNREQLVMVRPVDNMLCMTILRFSSELKSTSLFDDELSDQQLSEDEFKLAETLIDETTVDEFEIADYTDVYQERLTRLIESKVEGKELVQPPDVETAPVIDLMDALKASVERVKTSAPRKKKVAKRGSASTSKKVLAEQLAKPAGKRKSDNEKKTTRKKSG